MSFNGRNQIAAELRATRTVIRLRARHACWALTDSSRETPATEAPWVKDRQTVEVRESPDRDRQAGLGRMNWGVGHLAASHPAHRRGASGRSLRFSGTTKPGITIPLDSDPGSGSSILEGMEPDNSIFQNSAERRHEREGGRQPRNSRQRSRPAREYALSV
jgi:hypothetical protein